eukprot:1748928-Pyramimonas_sp.AAC.1
MVANESTMMLFRKWQRWTADDYCDVYDYSGRYITRRRDSAGSGSAAVALLVGEGMAKCLRANSHVHF